MAKFMQVPQTFLFRKYHGFWGNLQGNYDGECQDAFTEQELAKLGAVQMAHGRFEPCGPLSDLEGALPWPFYGELATSARCGRSCSISAASERTATGSPRSRPSAH